MKHFYLTAAIPYVNAKPHLGHVLEWFQADVLARYHRLLGEKVTFSCGTDENSLKNVQAAEKAGKASQAWLDEYAEVFKEAFEYFDISLTNFRRGSDQTLHWPGVQELWKRCEASGDIYKKKYTGLYCVGCESYYSAEELVEGKCPEHLTVPETITEENYFFRLSKYQETIKQLIGSDTLKITSKQYKQEMLGFISHGLEDFSVSRSVQRARGVGVPVPSDESQVMYVWFDALAIYLTSIGWGHDQPSFEATWPADVHVIGKGITRFHAAYWIGMLLSAALELPKQISVHGYITVDGQKMSKSLGNVIDPFAIVKEFGLEPVKYYLLKAIPTHGDGDFTLTKFKDTYNADLANGIGNLCSRVAKLAESNQLGGFSPPTTFEAEFVSALDAIELNIALEWIQTKVTETDQYLSTTKPWQETDQVKRATILTRAIDNILLVAHHLQPFLPVTAEKITMQFTGQKVLAFSQPLFPRLAK